jgi:hypothetical protein
LLGLPDKISTASINGASDGQHEHFQRSGLTERQSAGRDGRTRRENIVNDEDALAFNETRALDPESILHALAPRAGVHPGAMLCGVRSPHETPFIIRKMCQTGEGASERGGLIKPAFTLALGVQR